MSERDTKFLGFARLQWERVAKSVNRPRDFLIDAESLRHEGELIIAQCAYDLVAHAISASQGLEYAPAKAIMDTIPDMTEWPESTSPIAEWLANSYNASNPLFLALRYWIEHDLKRDYTTLENVTIHAETVEIATTSQEWKTVKQGQRMLFEVTFADGYQDSLHLLGDGQRCAERADWVKR